MDIDNNTSCWCCSWSDILEGSGFKSSRKRNPSFHSNTAHGLTNVLQLVSAYIKSATGTVWRTSLAIYNLGHLTKTPPFCEKVQPGITMKLKYFSTSLRHLAAALIDWTIVSVRVRTKLVLFQPPLFYLLSHFYDTSLSTCCNISYWNDYFDH